MKEELLGFIAALAYLTFHLAPVMCVVFAGLAILFFLGLFNRLWKNNAYRVAVLSFFFAIVTSIGMMMYRVGGEPWGA